MRNRINRLFAAATVIALAACGGSGGGSTSGGGTPAPPPPEPVGTTHTLSISKVGAGTVTSSTPGIDCGTDCSEAYAQGTSVALSAAASPNYSFSGWSAPCTGTGTCTVSLSQARSITATFTANGIAAGCTLTRSTSSTATIAPTHPRILVNHAATKDCLQQLLATDKASATRFRTWVNGQLSGANHYDFQPWYAALMFQLTGEVRYATYAVAATETFVASEEALITANQRATVAGDSYLEVGPVIGNLALVYDWCYDHLTPTQRSRWITYANQAVWNVWNPAQARWGNTVYAWSGWSVDNPSNNYYYSFLRATMLLGLASHSENAQAPGWITQFRTAKLETQLFPTFARDLEGGGSREGTGYGTAMKNLWQLYDWWERSTGERVATRTSHTLASMAHLMHSIVPTLNKLAPTGDHARDSSAELFDYHREYLLELMALFPQERLSGAARALLDASTVPRMQNSFEIPVDFLYEPPVLPTTALGDLSASYWGAGTGQFMMRSAWDTSAAYANFICGPYSESHAHHDQGSFVIYRGDWLAYDSNTVSSSGIEQGEALHNLVRIEQNGNIVTQVEGAPPCQMLALADNAHYAYGLARVTPIYNGKAAVGKVEREFLFIKPATFVVLDRAQSLGTGTRRVWTLNLPAAPTVTGDTFSLVRGANRLDVTRLAPSGLTTQVSPWPSLNAEIRSGVRVDVPDTAGDTSVYLHVMGTNSAVTQTARSDATGQTGATITLADGRTATVRFSTAGTGGTLELRSASGSVLTSGALPSTVSAPPLFRN